MNRTAFITVLTCLIFLKNVQAQTVEIFVGTKVAAKQDGSKAYPFTTIEAAINKATQLKKSNSKTFVKVYISQGNYHLASPIVIPTGLGGLTLQGAGNNLVTIMGSIPLHLNWKKKDNNIYVADVADDINFDQLIVNDKPQILARYPNYNENGGYWQGFAADAISKERIKTWSHPAGAYFHAMHKGKWGSLHYTITGVDSTGNAILKGGQQNNRPSPPHQQLRMVENVLEELDSPGEWFLDGESHKLYYWPAPGVDLSIDKFEASILKNLITIKGSEKEPVRNVTIAGIKFANTQRTVMDEYEPLLRSDWSIYRGAAVFIQGAEDCKVESCEFTNLGGNVIFVSGYNRNIKISENHIHECGASAICFVGDPSAVRSPAFQYGKFVPLDKMDTVAEPKSNLYPKNCIADNNLIYRIGRIEKQAAGVEIAMAMNITVSRNSIYDVPRAGINIGDGTWGGHILEYNDVFNTVLESGDHGSFNSWGRDRFWHPDRKVMDSLTMANPGMPLWDAIHTTIIRNNRFRCDHGWDIDLDDGSTNYYIYNNLCLNGGLKLREGFNRIVENNIIINNSFHPHVWFMKSNDVFQKNIVFRTHKDIRLNGWGKKVDDNFFASEESLKLTKAKGVDKHSIFGNPQFVNPNLLDYSVAKKSPALKIGFLNFPMNQFGVQSANLKKLAKTPAVPVLNFNEENPRNKDVAVTWLGAKVKNIESMEEVSASGLSEIAGVIILELKENTVIKKTGLQKGDVIIEIAGKKIKNTKDLLNIDFKIDDTALVPIIIMRNQARKMLNGQ